ncbi:hypothetical protein CHS0354_013477 [Potamilus streckersoni]|uniref:Heat shock protein 70 n=1 Tax=Potamilus streckersoni TaxID=2493646 RepID=A0AAE0T9E0_9BIVA|nr:hypothetical protein CHS0354_013477 [Potamilus streckersoni]
MIVDLGGGTADMTVHEKLGDGKLKEIWKASGGPWGGTAVDSAFFQMLISIVGGPVMGRFMKEHTYDYLDLFREFESAKRNFSTSSKDKINIKFPVTLNELCEDMLGSTFKTCTSESIHGNDISFVSDKMRLTPGLLEMLFRKVTYNIIDHIKGILSTGPGRKVSLILMVGGFSESQFVQEVILKEFHGKNGIQIVVPRDAGSTVVNGAVLFGRMPRSIESRILRYTYGKNSCPVFDKKVHPEEKKIIIDGVARCNDVFGLIIDAGTEIKSDFKLSKSCFTVKKNQRTMCLSFHYSVGKTPMFTTDPGCHLLGTLRIEIPNPSTEDRYVDLTYEFGSTELKVTAVERTSNKPCIATFILIE